jgi:hypothetical protein
LNESVNAVNILIIFPFFSFYFSLSPFIFSLLRTSNALETRILGSCHTQ